MHCPRKWITVACSSRWNISTSCNSCEEEEVLCLNPLVKALLPCAISSKISSISSPVLEIIELRRIRCKRQWQFVWYQSPVTSYVLFITAAQGRGYNDGVLSCLYHRWYFPIVSPLIIRVSADKSNWQQLFHAVVAPLLSFLIIWITWRKLLLSNWIVLLAF